MLTFTAEELHRIMDLKHNIRNICVIDHVVHDITITDSLESAAVINALEVTGDVQMTDVHQDEAGRGAMIVKSTGISLYYKVSEESLKSFTGERNGNEYLINIIDLPGHMDFSYEATAALRITDGALVVVDCVKGVCGQTETDLRQALRERIRPVLAVDLTDKSFSKLQVDGEEAYRSFQIAIKNANVIMARTYEDPLLGDAQVYPDKGTVAFFSRRHGWAFSLSYFAKLYASKFGVDESKMMERLWGENFFDPATKKWTVEPTGSSTCKRGFVQLCYEPIKQIIDACLNDHKDQLWPRLQEIGVTMESEEKDLCGKALMKRVMQTWLPASNALLEMMVFHLPSPCKAQRYRVENLYGGPLDDVHANAIRNCDPDGPLVLYVSKKIPDARSGCFVAFGRVFSGKLSCGRKARIMEPDYFPVQEKNLCILAVHRATYWMGGRIPEYIENVPCGNTVIMVGVEVKINTTRNEEEVDAPIVVPVTVKCKTPSNLPMLFDGFKHLANFDPMEGGAGEIHLEICLKEMQKDTMGDSDAELITTKNPVFSPFRRNKSHGHNGLYMEEPLMERAVGAVEEGKICPSNDDGKICPSNDDRNVRAKILREAFF